MDGVVGDVVVMVNNLGATTGMELAVVANAATAWLEKRRVNCARVYVGAFMTALDMTGFSISLLRVDPPNREDCPWQIDAGLASGRLDLLDAPTGAPAWPRAAKGVAKPYPLPSPPEGAGAADHDIVRENMTSKREIRASDVSTEMSRIERATRAVKEALEGAEKALTEADTRVGDGDCGVTHVRGAAALSSATPYMHDGGEALSKSELARSIGLQIRKSMGGTSGALYDIAFAAAAAAMTTKDEWFVGFEAGTRAMMTYGGAKAGDRTILDALIPAMEAAREAVRADGADEIAALRAAAAAAAAGAEKTKEMTAGAGRSSYVPAEVLRDVADPGATAAAVWIGAVSEAFAKS